MDQNQSGATVPVDDDVEALRISQEISYFRNRAALGAPSLDLLNVYSALYHHLWSLATTYISSPVQNHILFGHQMVLESKASLVRTMLFLIRGHVAEAHAQTRRAIECCAWAKRIHDEPDLVVEWMTIDMHKPPSPEWRKKMGAKHLFPLTHAKLNALRPRHQMTSRCLHPFRFSFSDRIALDKQDGTISVQYSFFESEEARQYIPTFFLWTLQTHDLLLDIFEEVFVNEISNERESWESHRKQANEAQTAVGRMWIEITQRAEERRRTAAAAGGPKPREKKEAQDVD
jgi:hypothetical protein